MIPDKLIEILKHEAPVAIVTSSPDEPHLVGTWNSYIRIDGDNFIIPAGHYNITEENIRRNNRIQLMVASREVEGMFGPGSGYLITGSAVFETEGPAFEDVKSRFPWARAALVVNVKECQQTL